MCCGDDIVPIFFPNTTMDIYTYTTENTDYDYFGKKNEYVFIEYGTMYRMAVAKEHPAQYSR